MTKESKGDSSQELDEVFPQQLQEEMISQMAYFATKSSEAFDSPPMVLDRSDRKVLQAWGKTVSILRGPIAQLDLTETAKKAQVDEATLFMFESGLIGGEAVTASQLYSVLWVCKDRIRIQEPITESRRGSVLRRLDDILEKPLPEQLQDAMIGGLTREPRIKTVMSTLSRTLRSRHPHGKL